jgi:hypothetical protein
MTQVLLVHALETVPTIATCRKRADTRTAPRAWLPLVPAEDNRCVRAYLPQVLLCVVHSFSLCGVVLGSVVVAAVYLVWVWVVWLVVQPHASSSSSVTFNASIVCVSPPFSLPPHSAPCSA